jgi:hypothetical protein
MGALMQQIKLRAGAAVAALAFAIFGLPGPAWATGGAVDLKGCHESKKIGLHCHPERAAETLRAVDTKHDTKRRLQAQCKGQPDAGACKGYGVGSAFDKRQKAAGK